MTSLILVLLCVFLAYGLGCINPAWYGVRLLYHKDLRKLGSGTLGTRNVYRNYGLPLAVPVFLLDLCKLWPMLALLPVMGISSDLTQTLVIFAGVLGHIYPVQFGFCGGKGLAIFMGAAIYILLCNPSNLLCYTAFLPVVIAHRRKPLGLNVKLADTGDELEQIFALNYQTFVEEIPQHSVNADRRLQDKFHQRNTYVVCKDGSQVIAMASFSTARPFSLDAKVADLDAWLPTHGNICEVRLLSVKKEYRHTRACATLLSFLIAQLLQRRVDMAVISGTTRQLKLYKKLGFQAFYELVGTPEALYQPMYITRADLRKARWLLC